jgi:hypothetical protein
MKRYFLIIAALLLSLSTFSQNYSRAIGVRTGSSIGFSYKQFLAADRAGEAIFDIDIIGKNTTKIKASCYYEFHADVNVDGLSLYAGPGASAGVYLSGLYNKFFVMSVDALAGVEYKFNNLPIVLAFDWIPKVQFITDSGFKPANFAVTARYTF